MSLSRVIRTRWVTSRWVISPPWVISAVAGVVSIVAAYSSGERQIPVLVIIGLAGAALGLFLQLALGSIAVLSGTKTLSETQGVAARMRLEQDKRVLLRSIKDIEFDINLNRLSREEGESLVLPLRERAMRLLEEIDRAKVEGGAKRDIDKEIDAEIDRRLATLEAPAGDQAEATV